MLRWLKPARIIERPNMEMRLGRQLVDFAGQRGAAGPAEARVVPGEDLNFVISPLVTV